MRSRFGFNISMCHGVHLTPASRNGSQTEKLQRPLRELLRDARVRAARSTTLPDSGGRAPGHFRLHRRLVQPTPPPFRPRLPLAHDLRAVPRNRRSHSGLRIDDRPGGCYLSIPLRGGTVTIPKAVHPPPNRGNFTAPHSFPYVGCSPISRVRSRARPIPHFRVCRITDLDRRIPYGFGWTQRFLAELPKKR